MKTSPGWAETIIKKMDMLDIKQEDLARLLDMTRGNIGHYLSGRRDPPLSEFIKIASVLNLLDVPLSQLLQTNKKLLMVPRPMASSCPILTWEEAKEWPRNRDVLDNLKHLASKIIVGANCYALKIKNDLMVSKIEGKNYKEGGYIIVDPDKKPKDKNLVVVKEGGQPELLFREYRKIEGCEKIRFFMEEHPDKVKILTPNTDITICGVVVLYLEDLLA